MAFFVTKNAVAKCTLRPRGRSGEIRTPGLMDPNHARYQLRYTPKYSIFYYLFGEHQNCHIVASATALRPEILVCCEWLSARTSIIL